MHVSILRLRFTFTFIVTHKFVVDTVDVGILMMMMMMMSGSVIELNLYFFLLISCFINTIHVVASVRQVEKYRP